jgi:multiple sugar transport system substrate-binding protein
LPAAFWPARSKVRGARDKENYRRASSQTINQNTSKGEKVKRLSIMSLAAGLVATMSFAVVSPAHSAGIEMTYLTPAYLAGTVKATERIVADWNKANPSTTVKIVYGDVNNMQDKLSTAFAGNVAPDIFQHEAASILTFAKQGYLADLSSEMRTLKPSIPTGLLRVSSYKARLYGVPTMTQSYTIYANVDMFKKAGVAIPTGSGTLSWDQYADLAKKFTKDGQYGVAWGLKSPAATFMIMSMNFGGVYFRGLSSAGGAKISVGPAELQVPERVYNMIYKDKSVDPATIVNSGGASIASFLAGKYAMVFAASYVASDLDVAAKEKGFNWTALPLLKGTSTLQGANPQTLSVSAQSKYKKPAAAFIRFMMQAKNLSELALGEGLIPSTSESLKASLATKAGSAGWTAILDDGASFTLAPFTLLPNYQKWKDTVAQPIFQKWVQNKISESQMKAGLISGWNALR